MKGDEKRKAQNGGPVADTFDEFGHQTHVAFFTFFDTCFTRRLVVSFRVNEVLRRADWQLFLLFFADT